jgi:hypothetical protein
MEVDLQLLRIVQTGLLLIHFPLAGVAIGGTLLVIILAVFAAPADALGGRPLAAALAVRLLPAPGPALLLVALLALALFSVDRLHGPPAALAPTWFGTLAALLVGLLLLLVFRQRAARGEWRGAGLLCAGGGALLLAAYLVLFWGLDLLARPHLWPFLPGRLELWPSWNGLVRFLQFAALSLALTGAALLRSPAAETGTSSRSAGSGLVLAGLLAWPPLLLLDLLSLPDNAASIGLFILLGITLLLAAAASLLVLPRSPSPPLLMAVLLALFLLWLVVAQLSRDQALAAPAGPLAPLVEEGGR